MTETMGIFNILKWVFEAVYISIRFFFPVYAGIESRAIFLIFSFCLFNAISILIFLDRLDLLQYAMIPLLCLSLAALVFVIWFPRKEYYECLDEKVPKRKNGALLFVFIWTILSIGLWGYLVNGL